MSQEQQEPAHDQAEKSRMTASLVKKICRDSNLYSTPNLNDKLYLHFKGFRKIENLEEYTGIQALWLEANAIYKIENLSHMKELKCLYLQQNMLTKLEGLDSLSNLHTLDVGNNRIPKIENLEGCPDLDTLNVNDNRLTTSDDIQELTKLKKLTVLNIMNNKLADESIIENVFAKMPSLGVLYLKGNPIINNTKNYRKRMISSIPTLNYLDELPVFDKERRCVMAWARGGVDAEFEERQKIRDEEEETRKNNLRKFEEMQEKSRQRLIQENGGTEYKGLYSNYGLDDSDTEGESDDEEDDNNEDNKEEDVEEEIVEAVFGNIKIEDVTDVDDVE
ncbi:dynein assembly factor 1 [Acrasis kona]|uniref:Dynein assembly factor 1 n=1 Tax=Acrasis kona TaxID=1008807 RepID=A0AAW2YRR2_9EUKA